VSGDPVTYDAFMPEVLPFVHGCSDLVATHAVKNAVIEFCEKTDWWLHEIDPIYGMVNVQDYDLDDLPDQTSIVRVVQAAYGGYPIDFLNMDELRAKFGLTWRSLAPGSPRYATQVVQDQISLVPMPGLGATAQLTAFVALRPTRDSQECDSSIYERWAEVIGQGALSRLCSSAGQPFSNPAAAATYRARFNVGCNEAKRERMRGLNRGGDRVEMPRFV
jgi:hypothetical protein